MYMKQYNRILNYIYQIKLPMKYTGVPKFHGENTTE